MPGKTTLDGYGWSHQQERERWRPDVEAGLVDCWRCTKRIEPFEPWDLGHDDNDRSRYRGPEHRACNRGAAARKGARTRGWAWKPKRRVEHRELTVDLDEL